MPDERLEKLDITWINKYFPNDKHLDTACFLHGCWWWLNGYGYDGLIEMHENVKVLAWKKQGEPYKGEQE